MTPAISEANLWVLTSYFNPMRYRTRLLNYRAFRAALGAPLVAVELGYHGHFELNSSDADILLQLHGVDILWQKERLLNLALASLPPHVRYVAWLDCDVILDNPDWPRLTAAVLEDKPLAQPYSAMYDLPRGVSPQDIDTATTPSTCTSIAYRIATDTVYSDDFRPSAPNKRYGFGFAWAARRDLLDRHGLYDVMILGGGDRMIAYAACGRFSDAVAHLRCNGAQAAHYLAWAEPLARDVQCRIGYAPGNLFHLWHGDLKDRLFFQRHHGLQGLQFDPSSDLAKDAQGCWKWATHKPLLQAYVADYLASRKEDG